MSVLLPMLWCVSQLAALLVHLSYLQDTLLKHNLECIFIYFIICCIVLVITVLRELQCSFRVAVT